MSSFPLLLSRSALLSALLLCVGIAPTRGDDAEHIGVTATGKSTIQPDVAEIRAAVSGSAAMAADALKKFRDNRRRAIETLRKLKLENLAIEGGGLAIRSTNANAQRMAQMFGGNANGTPGQVTVTETLLVRLSAIDHLKADEMSNALTKVLDTAKDAGLTTGGPASGTQSDMVRYRSTKFDEARSLAVKNAMAAARRKADLLAAASNKKIRRVVSSREVAPAPTSNSSGLAMNWYVMMAMAEMGMGGGSDVEENASSDFQPIPVSVTVEVQFATQEAR